MCVTDKWQKLVFMSEKQKKKKWIEKKTLFFIVVVHIMYIYINAWSFKVYLITVNQA